MNPISNTAYYCCGVRMLDAEYSRSICNDRFAKRFMDKRGMQIFEPFKNETLPNLGSVVRCRMIDDAIRQQLTEKPDSLIISIGAGFDTRPYRIDSGVWIEVDEPQIITYKNDKLPIAECKNKLTRISIDFSKDTLHEKLADYCCDQTNFIIVIEGVFMYLENNAIETTVKQLTTVFPRHTLLCDLMAKKTFEQFSQSVHKKLAKAGGNFTERPDDPTAVLIEYGYKELSRKSMFERANELGFLWNRLHIPSPIAKLLYKTIYKNIKGYAIHLFKLG